MKHALVLVAVSTVLSATLVLVAMRTVFSETQSDEINLFDVYQKQFEIVQLIKYIHLDLVTRVSYSGDQAAAMAELNDLRCERHSIHWSGLKPKTDFLRKMSTRLKEKHHRCVILGGLLGYLSYPDRYTLFLNFSYALEGNGHDPYGKVWSYIKSDPGMLSRFRAAYLDIELVPDIEDYIDELDEELRAQPRLPFT